MQVKRINTAEIYQKRNKNQKEKQQANFQNYQTKADSFNVKSNKNASFKGHGPILKLADLIENGGLFVSFTLQDMLGTNIPRPLMGLFRNSKENSGKKNTSFALKELTREMLTGPSMFIIPAVLLKTGKPFFGDTINTPMKSIESFGKIFAKNPTILHDLESTKKEFYKNSFAEMIKNAKNEFGTSAETIRQATEFSNRFMNIGKKPHFWQRDEMNAFKKIKSDFADDFANIVKAHAKDTAHTDFTKAAISKTYSIPFNSALDNMREYSNDVVTRIFANKDKTNITEKIQKMTNKRVVGRMRANIIMYAAVLTFLQVIPKLYNKAEGDKNSGLVGLMAEETFEDNSKNQDTKNNKTPSFGSVVVTKNEKNSTANNSVVVSNNKNKMTPSFGSNVAATLANTLTGNGIGGKIARMAEFEGCNVSFPLLLGIMGGGILFPRLLKAKDKYDREEILRRDLVTCATMCFAEKELGKAFSKLNEVRSGFVVAAKDANFKNQSLAKRFFDYIRPINGVKIMNSKQIAAKYSNVDKYNEGMKGFCEFIDGQGGKLNKVFSLTKDSKGLVQKILGDGVKLESADNKTIINAITKKINSDDVKKLTDLFKGKENPWVIKARKLNAIFTALSVCVLVPGFLGFLLPFINSKATKKRVKAETMAKNNNNVNTKDIPHTPRHLDEKKRMKHDEINTSDFFNTFNETNLEMNKSIFASIAD